ncbi:MAG: glycerol-3-phosphate 1-O-acyltransferase PlsY [Lachnospiraceae bacterium]|nr:glycerol-3-phosphate 1-O-acyltransferase PlsY [Lachnospiraceae bacterium]
MLHRVLCLVAGYIFGLFQTGYFVGKHMKVDIRTKGSGNSGTTNALRVLGPKAGAVVFAGDVGKSVVLCLIVRAIYSKIMPDAALLMMLYGGFGVILGHNYPFYLNFKGGKGIAATGGFIISLLDWRITLICALGFVLPIAITRYVSLGSLIAEALVLITWILFGRQLMPALAEGYFMEATVIVFLIAALAYWRHRANIGRLIKGCENKISFRKKKEN